MKRPTSRAYTRGDVAHLGQTRTGAGLHRVARRVTQPCAYAVAVRETHRRKKAVSRSAVQYGDGLVLLIETRPVRARSAARGNSQSEIRLALCLATNCAPRRCLKN